MIELPLTVTDERSQGLPSEVFRSYSILHAAVAHGQKQALRLSETYARE
jgi:hypothetical protein